ncbi:MAG: hypothetical protein LUC94_03490 [Clostridiales bacterium]|nr:hypothetical protein [Clostridiales bacterium]
MFENYTRVINNRCFDFIDDTLGSIWEQIENMAENSTPQTWKQVLTGISAEYAYSSRFALMRILCSRATGIPLNSTQLPFEFTFRISGQSYSFHDISMHHAETLTQEELILYQAAFLNIALHQEDVDLNHCRLLIARAFRDADTAFSLSVEQQDENQKTDKKKLNEALKRLKRETRTLLSRNEALNLGHSLCLSLNEMQWFLLRVFDYEDGFRFLVSDDLIEAYGFLTGASSQSVSRLKLNYHALAAHIPVQSRDAYTVITRNIGTSLPRLVMSWSSVFPHDRDILFMNWMIEQAPYLDQPSRTTTMIYRSLSIYACQILTEEIGTPDLDAFVRFIKKSICVHSSENERLIREFLYDGSSVSNQKCGHISTTLLEKNKALFTSAHDAAKAWRTISSTDDGHPRLIMAGRPDAGRNRVKQLLTGKEDIEKGDLLHLLWFTFNLCWIKHPLACDDPVSLFNCLADFTETCEFVLDRALLPAFYPPHLIEQSMMLSIAASVDESCDTGVPADAYAEICEQLIIPRKSRKKIS